MSELANVRIRSHLPVPSPADIVSEIPATPAAASAVQYGRAALEAILSRKERRQFLVAGPCSIHDEEAALEYAQRLAELATQVCSSVLLVMRVYFEKPRTTTGWKGLINDPGMDDSFDVAQGLRRARRLLQRINAMGVPVGTEALDPLTPQYLGDLVSWSAIGARTTESQTHREMASGLSTPVGFKNGTDGSLLVAINAIQSAAAAHAFLGIDTQGRTSVIHTCGNPFGHLILRGGGSPNYDSVCVAEAAEQMEQARVPARIVVDCSHGNSGKRFERQPLVLRDVGHQVRDGSTAIVGAMLESHLVEGAQKIPADRRRLVYGQSVTDACLGWEATREAILEFADLVS